MARFRDAFRSWRVAVMIPLGFASGLPNPLTGSTLTAWMKSVDVSLTTIGVFALVSLPYNFKFLWAPLVDRFALPWLGRRRGWMLLTQLSILVAVGVLGTLEPRAAPVALATMAFVVTFLSASQDIVSDAYRTDTLWPAERGSGTALFVAAYRVALIASGAGALILSDHVSWKAVYWVMASLMLVGVAGTLLAPTPTQQPRPPRTLREAVFEPLREFLRRDGVIGVLVVVALYKVGDAIASHMLTPFLMDVGFSRTEIGAIQKGLGLGATIVGALLGGGFIARWGLRRSLIVFGILQAVANVLYATVAVVGKSHALLVTAIAVDNLCGGLGTAAFVAFLMSLCDARFTAFQYALLSSLGSVAGRLLGAVGGYIAERWGWVAFFMITIAAAVPAIALLFRIPVREDGEPAPQAG